MAASQRGLGCTQSEANIHGCSLVPPHPGRGKLANQLSQSARLQGASDFLNEFLNAGASGFFLDGKCVETHSSLEKRGRRTNGFQDEQ